MPGLRDLVQRLDGFGEQLANLVRISAFHRRERFLSRRAIIRFYRHGHGDRFAGERLQNIAIEIHADFFLHFGELIEALLRFGEFLAHQFDDATVKLVQIDARIDRKSRGILGNPSLPMVDGRRLRQRLPQQFILIIEHQFAQSDAAVLAWFGVSDGHFVIENGRGVDGAIQ